MVLIDLQFAAAAKPSSHPAGAVCLYIPPPCSNNAASIPYIVRIYPETLILANIILAFTESNLMPENQPPESIHSDFPYEQTVSSEQYVNQRN
jgi:hypothetical protein